MPLTLDRAKPAVPFGGQYRLVDFVLSNLANAGFLQDRGPDPVQEPQPGPPHQPDVARCRRLLGNYVSPVPAQMRRGPRWFAGSADAIFQNLNIIGDESPDHICVFGADHIYRMDPRQMLEQHIDSGAGVTVAAIRVPRARGGPVRVIEAGAGHRIRSFLGEAGRCRAWPTTPDQVFASMGNYIFRTDGLLDALHADAEDDELPPRHRRRSDPQARVHAATPTSTISPTTTCRARPTATAATGGTWGPSTATTRPTWTWSRSIPSSTSTTGNGRSTRPHPNCRRPSSSSKRMAAPAGRWTPSWAPGSIISGGTARRSVLSPGVLIEAGAVVEDSVIMNDVSRRPGCRGAPGHHRQERAHPGRGRIGIDAERRRARVSCVRRKGSSSSARARWSSDDRRSAD